ncbi:MAG: hypothetical protein MR297_00430 [Tenericutes bacterium]|nr:hypothetical protein [Mycoplasmatota bacterium]
MTQKSFDYNYLYTEEVSPNEVNEYKEKEKNKKFILFVIIILLAVFLGMFIGYLLSKHYNKINDNTIHQGDLLGIYQYDNFTNYIENVKVYNSYDKSNKYKFYVRNDNEYQITYKLAINDKKLDNNGKMVNRKNLNYAVIKNGEKIKQGNLGEIRNNVLLTTSINLKSTDNYEILIWANSNAVGYYNYEIIIKK